MRNPRRCGYCYPYQRYLTCCCHLNYQHYYRHRLRREDGGGFATTAPTTRATPPPVGHTAVTAPPGPPTTGAGPRSGSGSGSGPAGALAATEQPGRLARALTRFATTDPAWTPRDVVDAVDAANTRLGHTSLTAAHIKTRPAAVLAWYLHDLDPAADHPRATAFTAGVAAEQRRPWCGTCDHTTRLIQLHHAAARCPNCHPLAPEQPW